MIRYSICGAASYVGGELLRLLSVHPEAELAHLCANSAAGKQVSQEHPALMGFYEQEILPMDETSLQRVLEDSDVVFTAVDAGRVSAIARRVLERGKKLIDFGADLRFRSAGIWEHWYHLEHPDHALSREAVYCIPELMRQEARGKQILANPGCYPTASTLALYPALREGLIQDNSIIIDAKSGYTGAGRRPSQNKLLCEAAENFCAYALGGSHRHTPEIEQNIAWIQGRDLARPETWQKINFQPHLSPQARGIEVTIYAQLTRPSSNQELLELYRKYYQDEPFLRVLPGDRPPQTKWTAGTNLCCMAATCDSRTGRLILSSVIDNIGKGAAGQAVQNMNLLFGLPETTGLRFPALYP